MKGILSLAFGFCFLSVVAQGAPLIFEGFENHGGHSQISSLDGPFESCGSGSLNFVPTDSVAGVSGSGDWVAVYDPLPVNPYLPDGERCGFFRNILWADQEHPVVVDRDALYRLSWDGAGVIGVMAGDDLGGFEVLGDENAVFLNAYNLDPGCIETSGPCMFIQIAFWLSAEDVDVAWLDNVRLDRLSIVSEPGIVALVLAGLGGLLVARRARSEVVR